tara:strand:+ start:1499 stop:2158 length:660 start_codon:yes stop_codon:yes gene_type:complete
MHYCIIIPVYNEIDTVLPLLEELEHYAKQDNEIVLVDDGSDDGTEKVLENCEFIYHLRLNRNQGKGLAIQAALNYTKYKKVIIFDGDLEVHPRDIKRFMSLDKKGIRCIIGARNQLNTYSFSILTIANFFVTLIFNIFHYSNQRDVLCCAKAFFIEDINIKNIKEKGFGIDIELLMTLIQNVENIQRIHINYKRRSYKQGKKIRLMDSFDILRTAIRFI